MWTNIRSQFRPVFVAIYRDTQGQHNSQTLKIYLKWLSISLKNNDNIFQTLATSQPPKTLTERHLIVYLLDSITNCSLKIQLWIWTPLSTNKIITLWCHPAGIYCSAFVLQSVSAGLPTSCRNYTYLDVLHTWPHLIQAGHIQHIFYLRVQHVVLLLCTFFQRAVRAG